LYLVVNFAIIKEKTYKINTNWLYNLFNKKQQLDFYAIQYLDKLLAYYKKLYTRNNCVKRLSK